MIQLMKKSKGKIVNSNIFIQDEEPETKEGIWFKSNELTYENIVIDSEMKKEEAWESNQYNTIPFTFSVGAIAIVGTDIYLFGGYAESSSLKKAYKYDTLTNEFTRLANIPYNFYYGSAVSVGTDIYLIGSFETACRKYLYKYDTLTNTYTQLTSLPVDVHRGAAAVVDNCIYIASGTYNYRMFKYDISTNTYTTLAELPFSFYAGQAIDVGNAVYFFGGENSPTTAYKYNVNSNSYTKLTNIPFSFANGSIAKNGTDIYLFGGSSASTTAYKYDTNTDTYTQIDDIPSSFYYGDSTYVGEYIYIFGGSGNPTMVRRLGSKIAGYPDNSILLQEGNGGYKTQLVNSDIQGRTVTSIIDAWHYTTENGVNETLPTYYGDGIQWNCFKNDPNYDKTLLYNLRSSTEFNGTSTEIDTGIAQSQLNGGYTIIARLKPTEWANYKGVFGLHSDNSGIVGLQYQNGVLKYGHMLSSQLSDISCDSNQIPVDSWSIIACIYDGTNTLQLYINNELIDSSTSATNFTANGNLIIGKAYDDSTRFFKGTISNFLIYNRVLSTEELQDIYNEITES